MAHGAIAAFARHPVAGNLLMILLIVTGLFAVSRLNIQFFPSFQLDIVTVRVVWRGASAEDVEEAVTTPLEQRLKSVAGLKRITSTSSQGVASITLELEEGTDPVIALDEVKQAVAEFRNLPADAETPEVARVARFEPIARVLLIGQHLAELRPWAHRFEAELLARGVDKVEVVGLPQEEIAIEVAGEALERLGLTLDQLAQRLAADNRDLPAGMLGEAEQQRELRGLNLRRDPRDYADLALVTATGTRIELGQFARIERRPRDGSQFLYVDGRPAVELQLRRAEHGHSLKAAKVLHAWLQEIRPQLPPTLELRVYDEQWGLIDERIRLLLKNGLIGLIIVVAVLLLFLNGRVTLWVAMGIPTAFLAALAALWAMGGSINMMSLFALIMALGVIVDDAIVVGEDAYAHRRMGEAPLAAAEGGARRMFWPVVASSLTTVAAFAPLMLVSGPIGKIMFDIPFIMICVLVASLIECFLILPAHLRAAFSRESVLRASRVRQWLESGFDRLRDGPFRRWVTLAVDHRATTVAAGVALILLAVGLLAGGRVKFTFFPTPEPDMVYANATFAAGTPRARVDAFLAHLRTTLAETEREFGLRLVRQSVSRSGALAGDMLPRQGDQFAGMSVELVPGDEREVRTDAFIRAWQKRVVLPPGLESFVIAPRRAGPPGADIQVRLTGRDAASLKRAALDLQAVLRQTRGVYGIEDDMPYGREQLLLTLTPAGEALGLTLEELSRQLRAAFDGRLVQVFQDGPDEVEVRLRLPPLERQSLTDLMRLTVRAPDGSSVPLATVARWDTRQGFEALRHAQTQLAVEVNAQVMAGVANANEILDALAARTLPQLAERYGVSWSFEGRAADQRQTMADMRTGVLLGLTLIYLVLAWVFAHYGWPLIIMLAIPFGLAGAILGHWVMGLDLTVLSLFGLFGLSGIVVNDSIILTEFYRHQREQGATVREAVINAACLRLRAIVLTSLTTIGGLSGLMLERSLQAQFLIPMATSISFGLMVTTLVTLLWLPAMLSVYESAHARLLRLRHPRMA
ncbi:MAG: efflux RND transporter permease subunit [Thiobacillaceae bacterium]|nr:efflux RND transporter permease subunit [Thiobacillaceae bacterium]MDW8323810.1 efflux RND transporter permease subunit [Burkholderiales bacterium]